MAIIYAAPEFVLDKDPVYFRALRVPVAYLPSGGDESASAYEALMGTSEPVLHAWASTQEPSPFSQNGNLALTDTPTAPEWFDKRIGSLTRVHDLYKFCKGEVVLVSSSGQIDYLTYNPTGDHSYSLVDPDALVTQFMVSDVEPDTVPSVAFYRDNNNCLVLKDDSFLNEEVI